jgi:ABC-type Fe3+-hydroxamate transport system substrate-binding protein
MRAINITILAALVLPILTTGCYTTQSGQSKFTFVPGRTDTVPKRFDRPVAAVLAASREALNLLGTETPGQVNPKDKSQVLTGRINSRYVQIKVLPDKQSPANISAVYIQVRTTWRNPDLLLASELSNQITLALIRAENKRAATTTP